LNVFQFSFIFHCFPIFTVKVTTKFSNFHTKNQTLHTLISNLLEMDIIGTDYIGKLFVT